IRNLFAGIEFLRYLEGEKHILFLSENGLALPGRRVLEPGWSAVGIEAQKQYVDFASLAADARVSISPIGTGGLTTRWAAGVFVAANASRRDNYALAEQTGGLASFYRFADQAVDRIDRATRFQYLLGYYPEATTWDGGFREIRVAVNRPDVTLHFRRGYFAREELVPYDRREFMSHSRIMAAATDSRPIRDVRLTISEPVVGAGADRTLEVEVVIDARDLSFGTSAGGERVAALHVAVFVGDRREALIGEQWDVVDLRFDEATYARLQGQAFPHRLKVALSGAPAHVKVVVYDYRADRIGTAERALR
ncbi:MAG TPA: hypothetical protein VMM93_13405, partial [Vicinamibacterales bacterium]|nr:hypothetical protein [Vicinamibacterales bacterium]